LRVCPTRPLKLSLIVVGITWWTLSS
jgi:hypothetical protein